MPKEFINIKLIIFDVNETMFSLNSIEEYFLKLGLPKYSASLWFSNVLKEGFANSCIGNFHNFKKIAESEFSKLFTIHKLKLNQTHVNQLFRKFSNLKVHDDILESLLILSKYKIPVVTLTNGSKENTIRLLKNNKISKYVKQCFSINEIKIWKPNKKTYLYVCKRMKIKPSNTLMIAAHGWDINGAKNAGLKTGYISRFESVLSNIYSKPDFFEKNCLSIIKKFIG